MLWQRRTCYLLAPFVKTSNRLEDFCHANGKKIIATRNNRRGQMKAFVFTKCAKVTLKKCKNAKIVNLYITRTQNGIAPCFIQFSQNLTCDCLLFLCFSPNLHELNLKLFCSDVQNMFRFSSCKFGGKHRNQQTITCQVLAELNEIWSCLIFIKLYESMFRFLLNYECLFFTYFYLCHF